MSTSNPPSTDGFAAHYAQLATAAPEQLRIELALAPGLPADEFARMLSAPGAAAAHG